MLFELGPLPATDVLHWTKVARRIIVELRASPDQPEVVSSDVIDLWARTLTEWTNAAQKAVTDEQPFRWSSEFEPEVAEFLLHGLDTCLHAPELLQWITPEEAEEQRPTTLAVVRAFIDGLAAESTSCQHYVDQVLTSFGPLLAER